MTNNRLNIVQVEQTQPSSSKNKAASRLTKKKELQAHFERLWLINPEQFSPLRNCMQKERLERTWNLLISTVNLSGKTIADIGCATGVFSRRLRDAGAHVVAVDIAENAIKRLKEFDCQHIDIYQDAMPITSLPDSAYDGIVCTEVIAELPSTDYRLFFAELNRMVKPDGFVICSTPIDIESDGGVQRFLNFAQTELDEVVSVKSYHALYLRIKALFETPNTFITGWRDPDFRRKQLSLRYGFSHWFFWVNTTPVLIWCWLLIRVVTDPIASFLKNSPRLLLGIEKICHFFWDESGVSHFIFLGKRRPLKMEEPVEVPVEHPRKKQIWE